MGFLGIVLLLFPHRSSILFFIIYLLSVCLYYFLGTELRIELALLNDAPRAATVRALSNLKVAKLDKRAFQRLLGPIKDIMARNDPRLQQQ
jgi:CRP-like cAMP-binding protein